MNIALVHDWITNVSGAERVLLVLKKIYPKADIYTSVYDRNKAKKFNNYDIRTTYLQKNNLFIKNRELLIPYAPLAFESLDLSMYDLVISSTTYAAKGVITKPNTTHVCYCHTPTRYIWEPTLDTRASEGKFSGLRKKIAHKLRTWDYIAAQRPDYYIANSETVKKRIKKYYRRDSTVIYPPVDIEKFQLKKNSSINTGEYYLYVSRLVGYKKADLVVRAFNKNKKQLIIIGSGSEKNKLLKMVNNNIKILDAVDDDSLVNYYQNAKAFVFVAEEDFGIVPIEAMACSKPVIAYCRGGASESVIDGITGVHFASQNIESLNNAIDQFESMKFDFGVIRKRAEEYSEEKFIKAFMSQIDKFLKT